MTSHASNRNGGTLLARNELSMPKWVSEQSGRVGPKPPPPPSTLENGQLPAKQPVLPQKNKQPEPDYEVIEFSNQQYSNAPLRPNSASSGSKTPDNKLKCTLCGSGNPWVTCDECAQQIFCASCDDMFHKHPKRKTHQRKTLEKFLPPLPPKILPGQPGPTPPVAPPRRNKRGFMTPIMQRKDQGNAMAGAFQESTSPTASIKNASWQERLGSLPRGLNLLNRPLPETPKTPSESSRSTTPKSAFDNIQRPPSVALEKIKSKANATLDRMQVLQQRYRQQKEQMERERSGSGSVTDQNMSAFDQWSSISQSPSHFRSGSMSSGINSSHLDLMDDTNFNLFRQRQAVMQHHQIATQRANQLGQRGISNSVFNLNQMNRKQPIANSGWSNNHLQQAQSMAQLNCGNCSQHQLQWNGHHMQKNHDPWTNQLASQQHLNRSNMSLNVPAGYMMQPHMNNMYPPPAFINQRNLMPQMYPQSYMRGMPVMNPGLICMPPPTSRVASRAGSRMASPAMSRKSVTLRRKQHSNYIDDEATDDEDSDEDDRRSITSTRSGLSRPRQRRLSSASQFQPDDDIEINHGKQHRNRARNQRRDSIAKSVHNDWAPGRRPSLINNNRSADSGFNSPLKSSRIYSDLDSEGSATKALVQAKIEQKLKEESLKQKQSKSKRQSKSPPPQKACAAVQTPAIKQAKKQEKIKTDIQDPMQHAEKSVANELESKHQASTNHKNSKKVKEQQQTKAEEKYASESLSESEKENESESELESEKSESLDSKQINDEVEQIEEDKIEEDDLGPPPSTPEHEWECEFCTFVNEANIKICSICCKTPSVKPKATNKSISPPKQTKQTTQITDAYKTNTIRRNSATASEKLFNQHSMTNNKETPAIANNSGQNKIKAHADTLKQNKESLEDIWDTFDENIQTTASEITRKAQTQVSSTNVDLQENFTRQSQAKEIDTSPTPQNISTQTYDSVPLQKPEKPIPEPFFNDTIQRSHFPASPKIQDLKSFEAEVLNKIHNISHIPPSHCHNEQSTINYYKDRPRYRSNNELFLNDTTAADFESFNGLLGKRQASINELLLVQKSPPQISSPFGNSTYDIPYRELSSMKHSDVDNHKESDLYKYTTEELNAALKYCGPDMHPLVWLRDNWPKLIQTVQSLATKYGQERAENTIGTISQMEAREALRLHTGNIWQAVSECIEQRQRKYREISSKGNFSREDIVTALTMQQGNVELALLDLGRTQLKPFLMRIWGSPGGVENESGSQLSQTATVHSPTCVNMEKDIHSFLSANASECMQTPNVTGAYLSNNQTPSPFDRPASLSSPLDSNSFIQDKTSADSSLQLDESILSNKSVLKDLEILIGNMEHNQQKQNEHLLRSVQDMISNVNLKIENEYDSEPMRILTKSPIISPKLKENGSKNEADVKEFVWQHIQEIVPDLVQQVEMELVGDNANELESIELKQINAISAPPPPPIDHDEFLMEEVIKPNIKNAFIREELPPQYLYTGAEIAPFQISFDKALEREHDEEFELITLKQASKKIYKMFKSLEVDIKTKKQRSATTDDLLKDKVSINNEDINAQQLYQLASFSNENALGVEAPVEEIHIQTRSSSEMSDDLLPKDIRSSPIQKPETNISNTTSVVTQLSVIETPIAITDDSKNASTEITSHQSDKPSKSFEETSVKEINTNNESMINSNQPITASSIEVASDMKENTETLNQINMPNEEFKNNSNEYQQTNTENIFKQSEQPKGITEFNEIPNQSSQNSNFLDVAQLDSPALLENASNVNIAGPAQQQNKSEIIAAVDTKDSKNETLVTATNKRLSKIPIRRTASNKSLVNSSTISNKIDFNGEKIKSPDPLNLVTSTTETESAAIISEMTLDQTEMNDLYSSAGNTFSTETISRTDQFESPTPSNEMFLVIQQEGSENANTIAPSTSNSTLNSTISQSFSFKSPTEFIPSGDPSKQNLTELVEDTQRLIKQMKDEISIDDFESSTDEGEYSDEFYDEYDDDDGGEEEGEEEEDWEEEEDGEYDDLTEDITEENEEVYGIEEDFIDNTKQSASPTQESQDLNTQNQNLVSSHHSLTFLHDNFEQVDQIISPNTEIQSENIIFNETAAFVETENKLPDLPVEAVVDNNLQISKLSTQYVESENTLPEMAVEIVLSKQETQDDDKTLNAQNYFSTPINSNQEISLVTGSSDVILDSTLNTNEVQPDNDIPNLVIQAPVAAAEPVTQLEPEAEVKSVSLSQETNTITSEMDSTTYQHELPSTSTANQVSTTILKNQTNENENSQTETVEGKKDNVTASNKSVKSSQAKKKLSEASNTVVKKSFTTSKIPKPKEATKQPKQKVAPVSEPKTDFKKKYTRSKSFSGPTTPIGIASVRSISQKFANPPPSNQLTKPKTSNAVTRKSSIAETINKFTKPSTTSEKSAAASSLLKPRTHPRIPKKKYHETCFSDDDYESSSEEEEFEPLEVRQRKFSVPVFKTYPSIQEPDETNTEELIAKFTKENLTTTVAEAQIAAALVAMKFPQDVSLWAAKECSDLNHAITLLKHECELCSGTYALNQIVSMLKCTHKCCKQCAKTYFTVQITERSINDCSCPFCKLPELHNQTEYEDENLEYFSNLDIFLKSILEPEVHELFQRKLRDRTLLKDPNFKWCVQCSSGFFARPKQKRLICPDCGSVTCAQCRKTWQKQHEGISCDQFLEWESANDPEVQAKGVQQHLEQNGIDCPKCKFKYSLARGGCMHFTCTQCKYEFCYGCAKPFMMGAKCNISSYCAKLGLHAHHPRNCLFYLRDKLPVQLQILLKNNNVTFEVDPLKFADNDNDNEPTSSKKKEILCPIPIQKETPTGLVDTRCNGDVPDKHAGMCRNHYVEYLTAKVAKSKIDPLPIFDLTDCVQELRRRGIPLPERGPWDTDEIYKNMCAEVIQKNIPLNIE